MNLVRLILLALADSGQSCVASESIDIDGYSRDAVAYHCKQLYDSNLIDAVEIAPLAGTASYHIVDITPFGHDFIALSRKESTWNKAVAAVTTTVGGATVAVMLAYLKQQASEILGLPPSP